MMATCQSFKYQWVTFTIVACALALSLSRLGYAHDEELHQSDQQTSAILADGHAPIGVMGDHRHNTGEWMFSYRFMRMRMKDNIKGDQDVSSQDIVSNLANPFGMPPTVRVVPIDMTTDMHMLGVMYAPDDKLTLMAMLNYVEKSMDHETYAAMNPSLKLGNFTTEAKGLGDTKISALYGLWEEAGQSVHLNLGISLPTGDIDLEDTVLTPMNTRVKLRMPYAMQLGSGTYDIEPGITYTGREDAYAWGAQWLASIKTGKNDEGYTLGDRHHFSTWGSYRFKPSLSGSQRLSAKHVGKTSGQDDNIAAPVQTANTENYGGDWVNLGLGFNWVGQTAGLRGHRIALEFERPIMQNVNGTQMKMSNMLTIGYQKAF